MGWTGHTEVIKSERNENTYSTREKLWVQAITRRRVGRLQKTLTLTI